MKSLNDQKHTNDLDELIECLPNCTSDELKQVQARCTLLLKCKHNVHSKERPGRRDQVDDDIVYSALAMALKTHGISAPPWSVFTTLPLYALWMKRMDQLSPFLEQLNALTKIDQTAILCKLFKILLSNLLAASVPITLNTGVNNAQRLPQILDAAFPGYSSLPYDGLAIIAESLRK